MLTITSNQLSLINKSAIGIFIRKCIENINEKFPDGFEKAGINKEDQEKVISNALKDARSYGIDIEPDLLLYTECIILLGINFDKKHKMPDWPSGILNDPSLSGESKMNLIHEHLIFSS